MKGEVLFFRSSVVRLGVVVGMLGISIKMRFRGFWIEVLALLESYV
jgi:hypothetical protein